MKGKYFRWAFCLTAFYAVPPALTRADTWDKKTIVEFSEPVEVPGYILQPGRYVMKLADSSSNHHSVQFSNERENRIYAETESSSVSREQAAGDTIITFYDAPAHQPQLIRNWYYPGDNFGQEFVYPPERLAELNVNSNSAPGHVAVLNSLRPSPLVGAWPVPETGAQLTTSDSSPEDASTTRRSHAQPSAPEHSAASRIEALLSQAAAAFRQLTESDNSVLVIALLGLVSLGGALTARSIRRS